jgi:hypothetical protein
LLLLLSREFLFF